VAGPGCCIKHAGLSPRPRVHTSNYAACHRLGRTFSSKRAFLFSRAPAASAGNVGRRRRRCPGSFTDEPRRGIGDYSYSLRPCSSRIGLSPGPGSAPISNRPPRRRSCRNANRATGSITLWTVKAPAVANSCTVESRGFSQRSTRRAGFKIKLAGPPTAGSAPSAPGAARRARSTRLDGGRAGPSASGHDLRHPSRRQQDAVPNTSASGQRRPARRPKKR